jgi:hypothetical protein
VSVPNPRLAPKRPWRLSFRARGTIRPNLLRVNITRVMWTLIAKHGRDKGCCRSRLLKTRTRNGVCGKLYGCT